MRQTRIQGRFHLGIRFVEVAHQRQQGVHVGPFSKEQETVNPEVVGYQGVYLFGCEFLAEISPQIRGVASLAMTLAVCDIHCQGHAVGHFFKNHRNRFGKVFDHYASSFAVLGSSM